MFHIYNPFNLIIIRVPNIFKPTLAIRMTYKRAKIKRSNGSTKTITQNQILSYRKRPNSRN